MILGDHLLKIVNLTLLAMRGLAILLTLGCCSPTLIQISQKGGIDNT